MNVDSGGPLKGIKVVELGVWIAGPSAALILCDWGADVVKIEPSAGDPNRSFKYIFGGDPDTNPVFELDNRGKRGISADISTDDGRQVVLDLLAEADVFISNLRPGALRRAGLDAETMLEKFPQLVYGHITGYGHQGPDAERAAYDLAAYWSRTGRIPWRSRALGCQFSEAEWVTMQQVSPLPARSVLLSCTVNAQVKANL